MLRIDQDARPVTEVIGDILQNLDALVRSEARLAIAEATEKIVAPAKAAAPAAAIAAGGTLLAAIALGGLLAAAAAALALVMAGWLAILVVALAAAVAGGITITIGLRHLRRALTPAPVSTDAKEHR